MAENSKIEWTTHTFSPWLGCQHVSPGCDNCFAEAMMDTRYGKVTWGPHGERKRTSEQYWKQPLRWARKARAVGERPRVFCASLCDVFDNQAPSGARADLFNLIRKTPELDWLLLTKRPENIRAMLPDEESWGTGWPNVWLGITAEDQKRFDHRWPILARIPAVVRFVSYEPAIGLLSDITTEDGVTAPDWLICGGETGKSPRDMPADWARCAKNLCAFHGTRFFMKQMTAKRPIPDDLMVRQFPEPRA